jgi:hypothetical protein
MLLCQSFSAAPAAILVCLQACIQGQVIVAGPVLAHNGESPFASNRPRALLRRRGCSLNAGAGDGLLSHRLLAVFLQDATSLRS